MYEKFLFTGCRTFWRKWWPRRRDKRLHEKKLHLALLDNILVLEPMRSGYSVHLDFQQYLQKFNLLPLASNLRATGPYHEQIEIIKNYSRKKGYALWN